jgi:hypothetical protein
MIFISKQEVRAGRCRPVTLSLSSGRQSRTIASETEKYTVPSPATAGGRRCINVYMPAGVQLAGGRSNRRRTIGPGAQEHQPSRSSSDPDRSDRKGETVNRSLYLVLAALALCVFASASSGEPVDVKALEKLTSRYQFAFSHGKVDDSKYRFIYSDVLNHIHVYRIEGDYLELDWQLTNLGSRVTSMFVSELLGDGRPMLVISTFGGRILIYDMDGYDLVWENLQDPFKTVDYLVAANVDTDPQEELIFVADEQLVIYDSLNHTFEWVSQNRVKAQMIKLANMDNDPQLEIVLNTGIIYDSKFYNVEFEWDRPFGARIQLFDMNGDGIPEIWGENSDFTLRVFDRYAERDIW